MRERKSPGTALSIRYLPRVTQGVAEGWGGHLPRVTKGGEEGSVRAD